MGTPTDTTPIPVAESAPKSGRRRWMGRMAGGLSLVVVVAAGIWVQQEFSRVRNRAMECVLMGEARQISSAANQYFEQTGKTRVSLAELVGPKTYIAGLSSDIRVRGGVAEGNLTEADGWRQADLHRIILSRDATSPQSVITLGHPIYSTGLSRLVRLEHRDGYRDANCLVFQVETGQVLRRDGAPAERP